MLFLSPFIYLIIVKKINKRILNFLGGVNSCQLRGISARLKLSSQNNHYLPHCSQYSVPIVFQTNHSIDHSTCSNSSSIAIVA